MENLALTMRRCRLSDKLVATTTTINKPSRSMRRVRPFPALAERLGPNGVVAAFSKTSKRAMKKKKKKKKNTAAAKQKQKQTERASTGTQTAAQTQENSKLVALSFGLFRVRALVQERTRRQLPRAPPPGVSVLYTSSECLRQEEAQHEAEAWSC